MSLIFFILYSTMSLLLLQNLQVETCQLNPIQNYERREEKIFKNQDTNSKKEMTDDHTFKKICNGSHNSSSCFFLSQKILLTTLNLKVDRTVHIGKVEEYVLSTLYQISVQSLYQLSF